MNFYFLITAIAVAFVLYKLLWVKNFHNTIFWGFIYQWLAVNIKVLYCVFTDMNFTEVHQFPQHIIEAWGYSNITIVLFALPIRIFALRHLKFEDAKSLEGTKFRNFDKLYIAFSFITTFILTPWIFPLSLQQIFYNFTLLRYCFLFIALNLVLDQGPSRKVLIYYLIFEFIISFAGFFANFKEYLIVITIVLIYRRPKLFTVKNLLPIAIIVLFMINLGIIWTAVKADYRSYISKGELVQSRLTEEDESLKYLWDKVSHLSEEQYVYGFNALINRISYIDYFSATISYVPSRRNHENGKKLLNALLFALQPRFLFPEKEVTDDSKDLIEYTGVYVSGRERATSISLGYAADAYIDFGKNFFITPLILGILFSIAIRILVSKAKSQMWALAILFPFYYLCNTYGMPLYKVIPPLIYYSVVAYAFLHFFVRHRK